MPAPTNPSARPGRDVVGVHEAGEPAPAEPAAGEIERLRGLLAKATSVPWHLESERFISSSDSDIATLIHQPNADLIVALVNAAPRLLSLAADAEAARAERDAADAEVEKWNDEALALGDRVHELEKERDALAAQVKQRDENWATLFGAALSLADKREERPAATPATVAAEALLDWVKRAQTAEAALSALAARVATAEGERELAREAVKLLGRVLDKASRISRGGIGGQTCEAVATAETWVYRMNGLERSKWVEVASDLSAALAAGEVKP